MKFDISLYDEDFWRAVVHCKELNRFRKMITDEDFEKLRRIVKELIQAQQNQLQNQMRLQKQIDLLQEAIQLLRKLNGVW